MRAKSLAYDRLNDILTRCTTQTGELAGQLIALHDVDAQRIQLVAKNAVLQDRLNDKWSTLSMVIAVAVSIAAGAGIGFVFGTLK